METTFTQDPNTPKYNKTSGLLTEYGRSLGLKEVNIPSNLNNARADTLDSSNITTPTPVNPNLSDSSIKGSVGANIVKSKADVLAEAEEAKLEEAKTTNKDYIEKLFGEGGINEQIGNVSKTADRKKANEARVKADKYTTDIEAEQQALDNSIKELEKNPRGLFGGALDQEKNRLKAESFSRQADLGIALNAVSRDFERLNSIADEQVKNNLAGLKAVGENLKAFIEFNKDDMTASETKLYNLKLKEIDSELKAKEKNEQYIAEIKKEVAPFGVGVLNALSKIDTSDSKSFDEALKIASPYLATSQNELREIDGTLYSVNKNTNTATPIIGGGEPKTVVRKVGDTPVSGYTLKTGDDPYFIAKENKTDLLSLQKVNPNIKDWNNLKPGETINIPQNEEDAFVTKLLSTKGGSKLTDTSIQKLDKANTVLNQLGVLQANIKDEETGPIVGAFRSANPWDTKGQTIKAQLNAIVPNLARGIYGEVGVLTDDDIKTYAGTIPNLKSTEDVRNAILYITLDMIGKSIKSTLNVNASAKRDVSGFVDLYTEMQNNKNSILQGISGALVPDSIKSPNQDNFLDKFSNIKDEGLNVSNNDFFN